MAEGLDSDQIRGLATLLSSLPNRPEQSLPPRCSKPVKPLEPSPVDWPTTGRDGSNARFQPSPGLDSEDVKRLELAWVLAIPGGAGGSPVVVDGRLFLSTGAGEVAALEIKQRWTIWAYWHGRIVRTVNVGPSKTTGAELGVFFADDTGRVFSFDAATGAERWVRQVVDHPLARATAAPSIDAGRVYVPMSSIEDPLTHDPTHECCTFRGSVTALAADTGLLLWQQHTIETAPRELTARSGETPRRFGPAGAAIYTPLAIDRKRGRVYAATAESYTREDPPGAYSVLAFEGATGKRVWERQLLPAPRERASICQENAYSDCRNLFSLGTGVTIHADAQGKDLLLVGQKSGDVYALDPDASGAIVWRRKLARGGDMGGIMYGIADDGYQAYVPVGDLYARPPHRPGDLVALDPRTGETRWRAKQPDAVCSWGPEDCVGAQQAAPTVIPGVVFASAWDAKVRARSTRDGSLLWTFDTGRAFEAINGIAQGGQIGAYPIQVVDGHVFVTSGASSRARPGNALLVFRPRSSAARGAQAPQAPTARPPGRRPPPTELGEGQAGP